MKRYNFGLVIMMAVGLSFLNSFLVYAETAEEYLKQGDDADDQGNSTQAIAEYNKAIEINPNLADAYNRRCITYTKQEDLTQALADCNKAIEINPNYAKAYSNRASIYEKQGNTTQAIADCDKAIEINPNMAELYYNRGRKYDMQGNMTQAVADYNKAIELNPKLGIVYNNRAVDHFRLKEYGKSLEDANKAKKLGYAVNPKLIEMIDSAIVKVASMKAIMSKEKAIEIAQKTLIEKSKEWKSQGKEFNINEEEINATWSPIGSFDNWTPQVQVYKSQDSQSNDISNTFDKIAENMNEKASKGDGYWEVTFVPKKYRFGGFAIRIDPRTGRSSDVMSLR